MIKGHPIRVQWGKSPKSNSNGNSSANSIPGTIGSTQGTNSTVSVQDLLAMPSLGPPPPGQSPTNYPSMNPNMMGTFTKTYKST